MEIRTKKIAGILPQSMNVRPAEIQASRLDGRLKRFETIGQGGP